MSDNRGLSSIPSAPQEVPGLPSNFGLISFEVFETLNTKSLRPAIRESECSLMDGWMPLGPNNLRILYGVGASVYGTDPGVTIEWFSFGNIADTPYAVVLLSDGSVISVNTQTTITGPVMPAGTIQNPSSIMGFSQWGSLYLIFAKDQDNGYWLWDGNSLFTAGTFAPQVNITNAGEGYTSAPLFTIQDQTGIIVNGAFSGTVQNGSLTEVTVTNPGSGFTVDSIVAVTVLGGGSDDQAIAAAIDQSTQQTKGGVDQVVIINPGNGYTGRAYAVFTGGGGSGATASLAISNGVITAVAIINPGLDYTTAPTVTVTDPGIPGSPSIPGGTGFSAQCNIRFGQITSIGLLSGGSGYTSPPTVKIMGDGSGAAAVARISGGAVTDVLMTSLGSGYSRAVAVFEGGNRAANIDAQLMPFGVSGTSVEIYQGSVWVTNGAATANTPPKNRTLFSAPNSPQDFGDGGGAFASFDSFLRIGYHWLKQSNGFLYLGGDSSLNYISGVQTTTPSSTSVSAQPITTFSNQNVDPQIGSPWPSSVQVFSRNVVFANTVGVYASYGGAVTKVSLPLDGFYYTGPIYGPTANFSSAVAEIFGIPVYMLLLPVIDPFTGESVNKLLMWDGKRWFTSQQDMTLTYVAAQEINSVLTAWGTDGTSLFPLFQRPSTGFSKVVQSRLYSNPLYITTKTAIRLNGVAYSYTVDNPLSITIDTEAGLGVGNAVVSVLPQGSGLIWNGLTWNLVWGGPGLDVFGPYPIGQQGRMMGLTVQTTASNIALLSLNTTGQTYTINQ